MRTSLSPWRYDPKTLRLHSCLGDLVGIFKACCADYGAQVGSSRLFTARPASRNDFMQVSVSSTLHGCEVLCLLKPPAGLEASTLLPILGKMPPSIGGDGLALI